MAIRTVAELIEALAMKEFCKNQVDELGLSGRHISLYCKLLDEEVSLYRMIVKTRGADKLVLAAGADGSKLSHAWVWQQRAILVRKYGHSTNSIDSMVVESFARLVDKPRKPTSLRAVADAP